MKTIKTLSGATYTIKPDGTVNRVAGDKDIGWTLDGLQYTEGFLTPAHNYNDIAVGTRLVWYGVLNNKFVETIYSSLVASITEEES